MKKKNQHTERLPASMFILLSGMISAIISSAGFFASKLIIESTSFNVNWYIFAIIAWLPIILLIIGESFLFKYQFGWSAIKWLIAGFIAIMLIVVWNFIYSILLAYISYSVVLYWFLGIVPALILALIQFVVLRSYVSKAWLWIIAMIALSSITLPLSSLIHGVIEAPTILATALTSMVIEGIRGLVTAMVLTWFVRMTIKDAHEETNTENLISEQN